MCLGGDNIAVTASFGNLKEVFLLKPRKCLTAMLAAAMAAALLSTGAFAAENATAVDSWDGTADTSWYNETETSYHLESAEQLAGLAVLVNDKDDSRTFEDKTIFLETDIDLSGHEWVSIGDGNNVGRYFGGTFDGQGHRVANLTCTSPNNGYYGLFGIVSLTGTIQNLGVVDALIQTPAQAHSTNMGILADWVNQSDVINCYTSGTIRSAHEEGGFQLVGGLIGQCTAGTAIVGCYSSASIESLNLGDASDTVGGLVGQWENSTEESLISDCWFDGKIVCEYLDAGVGGILGANFDFYGEPGVAIHNSFVSTTDITCAEPGNITWIAALVDGPVTDCYWPNDPDLEEPYAAVVKLVVDWDAGTAEADPTFDQSLCGKAVADFTSEELLTELQKHAAEGVTWVTGLGHPVFLWDEDHISADYSAVEDAKKKVPSDLTPYTSATVDALQAALKNVMDGKSKSEQAQVDAMAKAIEDAVAALEYKDADYSKVDAAIEKAEALNRDDYQDFSAVDAAIQAVVRGKPITEQAQVDAMAKAIEDTIAALEKTVSNPSTGADTAPVAGLLILLASGCLVLSLTGKKRQLQK